MTNIFAEGYAKHILSVGGDATPTKIENVEAGVQRFKPCQPPNCLDKYPKKKNFFFA